MISSKEFNDVQHIQYLRMFGLAADAKHSRLGDFHLVLEVDLGLIVDDVSAALPLASNQAVALPSGLIALNQEYASAAEALDGLIGLLPIVFVATFGLGGFRLLWQKFSKEF